jgi:hypothetical protein
MFLRLVCLITTLVATRLAVAAPIDRHALVTRHNPTVTVVDKSAPFMVGNGNLGFTADITGLQTFQDQYSPLVPLMTQAQWAWHSFPNPKGFKLAQAQMPIKVRGKLQWYPYLSDWEQAKKPEIQWLRENPHRFSLGRLGLYLVQADGKTAAFSDLSATRQTLDMWTGRLASSFVFDGTPVDVETSVHPDRDLIIVRLRSKLLAEGRLGMDLRFPGVSAKLNPDPADWTHPESHSTRETSRGPTGLTLARQLDDTRYSVRVAADHEVSIATPSAHAFRLTSPGSTQITLLVEFAAALPPAPMPAAEEARAAVATGWKSFWMNGGVVDLTGSRDPRAKELERRIVMSQYLTAVNSAGSVPPQEEGLFSNSWNGKFHLEMHVWHAAHFAVWGRPQLLERSMTFYFSQLADAKARAKAHGVRGAWWPKMVGPEGRESPSKVNPFIMWQQPHPIYLAETLYKARPTRETLEKYRDVVFETAELLATWPFYDRKADRFVLGPPVIPGAGELRAAGARESHIRARVLALWHRHRAGVARAARHEEGSEMGQPAVPAFEAAGERRHLSCRGIPAGPLGASRVRRNARRETPRPNVRTAIIRRSSPRWVCCQAGAPIARPCAARWMPCSRTGTCARPGAGTGPCSQ